jgi:hypothetical protein
MAELAALKDAIPPLTLSPLGVATLAKFLAQGLWSYVVGPNGLWENLPYPWFMFASMAFVAWRAAAARRAGDIVLLTLVLLFAPFVAVCGALDYRYSQALIVIAAFYLAAAAALVTLLDRVAPKRWMAHAAVAVLAVAMIVRAADAERYKSVLLAERPFHIRTFHEYDELAPRIVAATPKGMRLATNNDLMASYLSLRYGDEVRILRLPADSGKALDWISSAAPERILVATGKGLGSYPPGVIDAAPGYRRLPLDDQSRYAYRFFARDAAH